MCGGVREFESTCASASQIVSMQLGAHHDGDSWHYGAQQQSKTAGLMAGYGRSAPTSRGRRTCESEEKLSNRSSSIFFPPFWPPQDDNNVQLEMQTVGTGPCADFMGACFLCQRRLGFGIDIFIYRGDRAFCSNECRYQHIVDDELSERLQHQILSAKEPAQCKTRAAAPSQPSPSIPVLG